MANVMGPLVDHRTRCVTDSKEPGCSRSIEDLADAVPKIAGFIGPVDGTGVPSITNPSGLPLTLTWAPVTATTTPFANITLIPSFSTTGYGATFTLGGPQNDHITSLPAGLYDISFSIAVERQANSEADPIWIEVALGTHDHTIGSSVYTPIYIPGTTQPALICKAKSTRLGEFRTIGTRGVLALGATSNLGLIYRNNNDSTLGNGPYNFEKLQLNIISLL